MKSASDAGARATWLPTCCERLRNLLVEEGSALTWFPHVRTLTLGGDPTSAAALRHCPSCGSELPVPCIDDWFDLTGVQPEGLASLVQTEALRTGEYWSNADPGVCEPALPEWHAAGSDELALALRTSRNLLAEANLAEWLAVATGDAATWRSAMTSAGGGDMWLMPRDETVAALRFTGTDWDEAPFELTLERTATSLRRLWWRRSDGGFIRPLDSGQRYNLDAIEQVHRIEPRR